MRFSRFRRGFIELSHEREKDALRIVADGAIAHSGVGEGRLIPLVILDTSSRPDLEEYIRVHQYAGAGDVKCQWGQLCSAVTRINPLPSIACAELVHRWRMICCSCAGSPDTAIPTETSSIMSSTPDGSEARSSEAV